jgi:hypothetical protein
MMNYGMAYFFSYFVYYFIAYTNWLSFLLISLFFLLVSLFLTTQTRAQTTEIYSVIWAHMTMNGDDDNNAEPGARDDGYEGIYADYY